MCTSCASGYLPTQSGSILGNSANGILNCSACSSPCASCFGNPTFCTSCISGFTLSSSNCISSFTFQIRTTFTATISSFEQSYLTLLNEIISAASVSIHNLAILSLTEGSVILHMSVNSFNAPGSIAAVAAETNLINLFSGTTLAGL